MNKLTVEIEYVRAAFVDDSDNTLCSVSVRREDGSLLYTAQYHPKQFSDPLAVVGDAVAHLRRDAHSKIL